MRGYLKKRQGKSKGIADNKPFCSICLCSKCRENIGKVGKFRGTCTGCITCANIIQLCPHEKFAV